MSDPNFSIKELMRSIDRWGERLNPGLIAVVIVLSTCLMIELAVRLPSIHETVLTSDTPPTIDPPALF